MALDPSIALNVRPVEMPNALAMYGDFQKAQANQLALRDAQRQSRMAEAELPERNALANMVRSGADMTDPNVQREALRVAPTIAPKFLSEAVGAATAGEGLRKARTENASAAMKFKAEQVHEAIQHIAAFATVADIQADIQAKIASGELDPEQARPLIANLPKSDAEVPTWRANTLRGLLTVEQQLATQYQTQSLGDRQRVLAIPKFGGADLGAEVVPGSEARVNATPGQVLASNTRLALKGQGPVSAGGGAPVVSGTMPVGRRSAAPAATGAHAPAAARAPAAPAEEVMPKMTGEQAKSTGYYLRAANAHREIDRIGPEYSPSGVIATDAALKTPIIGAVVGGGVNALQSPNTQSVGNAQRAFVNATLRRDSGAAISSTEWADAKQRYFPQPGDKPDVIAQKKRNRENDIAALRVGSGPGATTRTVREQLLPERKPSAAAGPRLTPEQAAKLKPGTTFVGTDGVTRVKH